MTTPDASSARAGPPRARTMGDRAATPDVAELLRARDAAEAANEAKSRYLVAVSHEIRSPLNAIYGYAQLLERGDGIACSEAGAVIRRSAEHLANLVDSLVEMSRIEGGVQKLRSDVIDLRALLDQVVAMFRVQAAAKGLDLALSVAANLPRLVKTDEKRLRQILINLVSNAVKYTHDGGVRIEVRYRTQVADIEVTDTGIGIADDEIESVFEPFERGTSAEALGQPGTGLGLAITRALARIMGGELTARSTPGAGSSFRLKLMLAAATPGTVVPVAAPLGAYDGAGRTVLVVDDDPAQGAVLQSLLRPLGFIVYVAGSGPEGIALAARCRPDLVLLDIQMPGPDGWQTAAALRSAHGKGMRIVMVSANVEDRRPADADRGPVAFVAKPFAFATLLETIAAELNLERVAAAGANGNTATVAVLSAPAPIPVEAAPFLARLRDLALIGHVQGLEAELAAFAGAVPAAADLTTLLRRHLAGFDLKSLLDAIDDAERR